MNRHCQPSSTDAPRRQRGSIVVYLAMALVVFGVMAMAGASRFGASIMGVSSPNCATQARLMAESGVRYAMARLRTATDQASLTAMITTLNGQTYTVDAAKGLQFTLTVTASGAGAAQVSAQGNACGGVTALPQSSTQASASGGVNVPAVGGGGGSGGDITPETLIGDNVINTTTGNSPISIDAANNLVFLGILGDQYNAGTIWFAGDNAFCTNGICTMNYGLRVYFESQWDPTSVADGITFAVASGLTNTTSASGGDPYNDMGEVMGWAGPGPASRGINGIRSPKIGLELDTWRNKAQSTVYNADSRVDKDYVNTNQGTDNRDSDHLAYVFWGSDTTINVPKGTFRDGTKYPAFKTATYDDNRHASSLSDTDAGTGSNIEPQSYADIDGTGSGKYGYYYKSGDGTWLRDGTKFLIRFELSRLPSYKNTPGDYPYILKTWVRSTSPGAAYGNVAANYTGAPPDLYRVVFLSKAMHDNLAKVLVGFAEASGWATQRVTVSGTNIAFKTAEEVPTIAADQVSYWKMSEGSGTALADTKGINPATLFGPTTQWYNPNGCTRCPAIRLDGNNNSHIHMPDSNSLDLSTQGSITAWFNLMDYSDWTHYNSGLVHKGDDSVWFTDEAYSLQFTSARVLSLYITDGTNSAQVNAPAMTKDSNWHHVAATWDDKELLIYIDGVLKARTVNSNAVAARNTAGGLNIGSQGHLTGLNYPYKGPISRVSLYNRVLTAIEIAEMAVAQ